MPLQKKAVNWLQVFELLITNLCGSGFLHGYTVKWKQERSFFKLLPQSLKYINHLFHSSHVDMS